MTKKLTYDFVRSKFKENGLKLLETEYISINTKMKYICLKHPNIIQEKTYDSLRHTSGCTICSYENRTGENNYKWNINLTEKERESNKTRQSDFLYVRWRKNIFKRDNYTCKICKTKGGELNAHHLNGYDNFPEQRLDINNGIILCETCHTDFHKTYGYGNNTKHQFKEFSCRRIKIYA